MLSRPWDFDLNTLPGGYHSVHSLISYYLSVDVTLLRKTPRCLQTDWAPLLGGSQLFHALSPRVLVTQSRHHLLTPLLCEFLEGRLSVSPRLAPHSW